MKKAILPLLCAALLSACDHFDRTDGHAMVTGNSMYATPRPLPPPPVVKPAPKPVPAPPPPVAKPAPKPMVAPQPAPKPAATPPPPPPAAKPAPAPAPRMREAVVERNGVEMRTKVPANASAPAAQPAPKPKYAVMPGQNRGLHVRPR